MGRKKKNHNVQSTKVKCKEFQRHEVKMPGFFFFLLRDSCKEILLSSKMKETTAD